MIGQEAFQGSPLNPSHLAICEAYTHDIEENANFAWSGQFGHKNLGSPIGSGFFWLTSSQFFNRDEC